MVATIEEIKEENLQQVVCETTRVNGDHYKERMEEDKLKAEIYGQSSAISRSTNDSKQILKQIEKVKIYKKNLDDPIF